MTERLDEVLRAVARVEAPQNFARRLRVRMQSGGGERAIWPRIAGAAAIVLLAIAGLLTLGDDAGERSAWHEPRRLPADVAPPPPRPAPVQTSPPSPAAQVAMAPHPSRRPVGRRAAEPAAPATDHERALAALTTIAPITSLALASEPLIVESHEVGPLQPLAPLAIPAMGDEEGEKR